ncbi:MAG: hypothetical protein WCB04_02645 [Mycobacteriales bacterium]
MRKSVFGRLTALFAVVLAAAGIALVGVSPAQAGTIQQCTNPSPPSWWATRLQEAADNPNDSVPSSWGSSLNMARIVCRESDFDHTARNGQYYGLGQMSQTSVEARGVSWDSYANGTSAHPATYYQLLAALRYCQWRYGDTTSAWQNEVNYGWW